VLKRSKRYLVLRDYYLSVLFVHCQSSLLIKLEFFLGKLYTIFSMSCTISVTHGSYTAEIRILSVSAATDREFCSVFVS